jgi:hypothetical protein
VRPHQLLRTKAGKNAVGSRFGAQDSRELLAISLVIMVPGLNGPIFGGQLFQPSRPTDMVEWGEHELHSWMWPQAASLLSSAIIHRRPRI